jgi:hypothetical protein
MEEIREKSMEELGAEFYMLMGNAIANWAKVEAYLFKICRAALGAPSRRTAIVFGRAGQLEQRRQLVNALLETVLPQRPMNGGTDHPDTLEWGRITKDMSDLLSTRNKIAHQPMEPHIDWMEEVDGGVGKTELWFEITTSEHDRARYGGPRGSLNGDDLRKHINDVFLLKERLATFYLDKLKTYTRLLP